MFTFVRILEILSIIILIKAFFVYVW